MPVNKSLEGRITFLNVGTRILLKDTMDQYLRTLGDYKTHYASSMQTALRAFSENNFHVIITEAQLSDGSAYRLVKNLGGNNLEDDLYVILAIEEKNDDLIALADELEVNAVLVKPFSAQELKAQIEKFIGWKKLPKEPWKILIKESEIAFRDKKYRDAETTLQAAIRAQPNQPEVYYRTGMYYLSKPDLALAKKNLEKAVELRPLYTQAISALGSYYLTHMELDKAEEYFVKAQKISPLNPDRCLELVKLYILKSIELCKASLRIDPAGSMVHYNLGKLQAFQKDYIASVKELDQVAHTFKDQMKNEVQTYLALARKLGGLQR